MMRTTEHTQQLTERDSAAAGACLFSGYLPSISVAAINPKWRPAS